MVECQRSLTLYHASVGKIGNEGRDGTEIDIMEKPWLDDRVTQNLHWDGYGKHHRHKGTTVTVPGIMEGWHTFALWWKPDEYIFYVDGKETWRTDAGGVCQVPLYIKFYHRLRRQRYALLCPDMYRHPMSQSLTAKSQA